MEKRTIIGAVVPEINKKVMALKVRDPQSFVFSILDLRTDFVATRGTSNCRCFNYEENICRLHFRNAGGLSNSARNTRARAR